jgi:hypothetical protein
VNTRALIFSFLAFLGVYLFFFFAAFSEWHDLARLAHSGHRTDGVITAKEPMNHASIRYTYSAEGSTLTGIGPTGWGGIPQLERVQIGDHIPVTYWSERPSLSFPGDPYPMFQSWCGLLFLWMPLISSAVGIGLFLRLRHKQTHAPSHAAI